jgi:hypothetical protein
MSYKTDIHSKKGTKANTIKRRAAKRHAKDLAAPRKVRNKYYHKEKQTLLNKVTFKEGAAMPTWSRRLKNEIKRMLRNQRKKA